MEILTHKDTEVDFISTPRALIDCVPKFDDLFAGIQDQRTLEHEARKISSLRSTSGLGPEGLMMRVACMPHELLAAIYEVNPDFLKDKREFYRWLDRHPYYRVGQTLGA